MVVIFAVKIIPKEKLSVPNHADIFKMAPVVMEESADFYTTVTWSQKMDIR